MNQFSHVLLLLPCVFVCIFIVLFISFHHYYYYFFSFFLFFPYLMYTKEAFIVQSTITYKRGDSSHRTMNFLFFGKVSFQFSFVSLFTNMNTQEKKIHAIQLPQNMRLREFIFVHFSNW